VRISVYIPPFHCIFTWRMYIWSFLSLSNEIWSGAFALQPHTTGRQALKYINFVRTALLLLYFSQNYEHDITSARASKHGRTFWLFTITIFIRISQYSIPNISCDSCYAVWRWTLGWCGLAFCFSLATLQGTLPPAYLA
jgi:hypothetical protein